MSSDTNAKKHTGFALRELQLQLAPPKYLSLPTAGIDVSASGIKVVTLNERSHGLELGFFKEVKLPTGSAPSLDSAGQVEMVRLLSGIAAEHHIQQANIELSEARGYLFEASVEGSAPAEWRTAIEQHLDEYVPLPPSEVAFDVVPLGSQGSNTHLVGMGYAKRVVDESAALFESAGITVRAIESETFSLLEQFCLTVIGKRCSLLILVNRLQNFLLFQIAFHGLRPRSILEVMRSHSRCKNTLA